MEFATHLDERDAESGKTLREMTLEISRSNEPTPNLFQGLECRVNGRGRAAFAIHPSLQSEATEALNELLVRLVHQCGDSVKKFFTSDHQRDKEDMKWDPVAQRI